MDQMTSKGLKALNEMRKYGAVMIPNCEIIEKELKRLEELEKAFAALSKEDEKTKKLLSKEIEKNRAFEIIKKKLVNLFHLAYTDTKEAYNDLVSEHYRELTQEEYDLLKEVLL